MKTARSLPLLHVLLRFLLPTLLFAAAVALCFAPVLSPSVVFVAPDAPLLPLTFAERLTRLVTEAPTIQNLVGLLPFGFAYEGTFWVDAYLLCLAAVFLLRNRSLSWSAAWIGGFCAGFTGYAFTLFCAGHRGVVDALAVSCLAFGALDRALASGRWRWWALLALILPLGLAAQADIWALVMPLLAAYGLFRFLGGLPPPDSGLRRSYLRSRLLCATAAVLFCTLLSIPALMHTFGAAKDFRDAQLTAATQSATTPAAADNARRTFVTDWSLPPEELLEWILPNLHGHTSYPFDPQPYTGRIGSGSQVLRQHAVHVGWLTLILALIALIPIPKDTSYRRDRRFWTVAAVITLLLALGRYTPLYTLITELPVYGQIRAPVKWLHLTGFALSILAGFGAQRLFRLLSQRLIPAAAAVLCLLIALNGIYIARPYLFPIDLDPQRSLSTLPPGTPVFASDTYHAWLRHLNLAPTSNPYATPRPALAVRVIRGTDGTLLLAPFALRR